MQCKISIIILMNLWRCSVSTLKSTCNVTFLSCFNWLLSCHMPNSMLPKGFCNPCSWQVSTGDTGEQVITSKFYLPLTLEAQFDTLCWQLPILVWLQCSSSAALICKLRHWKHVIHVIFMFSTLFCTASHYW